MDSMELIRASERELAPYFEKLDETELILTKRVLDAFREERVSQRNFAGTTGYGYDDIGRDTLERIYARVFETEAALVRPHIMSGTHALALCLYGVLRPGDEMLAASGKPYDTLEEVIGIAGEKGAGSLADMGIGYRQVELKDGKLDIDAILANLTDSVKLVEIQRSRGYEWRDALTVADIDSAIDAIHAARPDVCVMVDNCYGEFTQLHEPKADLMAGSLNKNPGGGIARTGGYVAGKEKYVKLVSYRLTCPGVGGEIGSHPAGYLAMYQGLFMAPHVVNQAVKAAALAGEVFARAGYRVCPETGSERNDIIQAIEFDDPDKLIAFCRAIQRNSPVDSDAVPEPWDMPGYRHKIIMAAGTFMGGASIELSCDAPIKPPYIGYMQGALTYDHVKLAIEDALDSLV